VEDIVNPTAASGDKKFTRLGASYNFGVATAKASYGKAANMGNAAGADATDWQLGVDFPMSAALTLSANVARSSDNAAAGDNDRDGFGVGASYTLSKRTFLYGGYRYAKEDFKAPAAADTKTSLFAVGMQHRF
jgi:predicted porin